MTSTPSSRAIDLRISAHRVFLHLLINTLLGLSVDIDTMRPVLGGVTGGLSGPAVKPVALRAVWQVAQAFPDVPIVGVGGIRTGADALEFIVAGACAVQVGTAIFNDPSAPIRVVRELRSELAARGHLKVADLVGAAHRAQKHDNAKAG